MYFISDIVSGGQQVVTFLGLHQKSSYALDQKPVTKYPGAAYVCVQFVLLLIETQCSSLCC